MNRTAIAAGAFALLVLVAIYSWVALREPDIDRADPGNANLVTMGAEIYRAECSACHGADLEGQPNWRERQPDGSFPAPPHDQSGHTWHHGDDLLFSITKYGGAKSAPAGFVSRMPAFGEKLSDREIWAVLSFIKSRWPEDVRQRQARIDAGVRAQQR